MNFGFDASVHARYEQRVKSSPFLILPCFFLLISVLRKVSLIALLSLVTDAQHRHSARIPCGLSSAALCRQSRLHRHSPFDRILNENRKIKVMLM